jgi:hypothetical protein
MYSPPPDDVISQEFVYKLIPKISDYLKEIKDALKPEKYDPLELEIRPSSSDDDESDISYINEEEVDPSLRLEVKDNDDEEEPNPKYDKIDPGLHLGIYLFVGAIIVVLILIGLITSVY